VKRVVRVIAAAIIAPATLVLMVTAVGFADAGPHAIHRSVATEATAALAAAHLSHTSRPLTDAVPDSPINCNAGFFCVYSQVSAGNCLIFACPSPCDQTAQNETHVYTTCANAEESLYNNLTSGKARLYYNSDPSTDGGGPWICIDYDKYIDNLSTGSSNNGGGPYLFDQGPDANEYEVWRDAHSVQTLSSGTCDPEE
jgi:hypothetical protein